MIGVAVLISCFLAAWSSRHIRLLLTANTHAAAVGRHGVVATKQYFGYTVETTPAPYTLFQEGI